MDSSHFPTDGDGAPVCCTDRGNSLIEVMIAIFLMGLIASSIIAGIRGVIAVSQLSDDQARVSSVLGSASDRVANFSYSPCPETVGAGGEIENQYQSIARGAVDGVNWDPSVVEIVAVEYWQPGVGWSPTNGLAGTCNSQTGLTEAASMQKVTIQVTSESGKYTLQSDVIKTPVVADYNPANDPNNT
jgi:prepilin-type N-terminal cleavage/methylation domain-containing protein